jgi:UDP-N-acetylmuramate dehydrogenase
VLVTVGAQAPLTWLGRYAAERGWAGMDWGVGLPGQVGGATVNNAGAHGTEMKEHLVALDILHDTGEVTREDVTWLQPSYRMTRIKGTPRPRPWTVLRAVLRLPKGESADLIVRADEHAEFRRRTQPTGACSGSVFANPEGDFAARLIEEAGLKGHHVGAMQLSPKHANWMMNTGGGTSAEARELIDLVRETVRERYGVELRPEIEFLGG